MAPHPWNHVRERKVDFQDATVQASAHELGLVPLLWFLRSHFTLPASECRRVMQCTCPTADTATIMPGQRQEMSDDEASDSEDVGVEWLLGFAEPAEHPSALLRHRFPSKVGGRPAWLNPRDLPAPAQLTCSTSGRPMQFLMQVYAPPPEDEGPENLDAFHRTIFLFVSPEGADLTKPGAVQALRCQLPRSNPFYPYDPMPDTASQPPPVPGCVEPSRDPWRLAEAEEAEANGSSGVSGTAPAPLPPPAAAAASAGVHVYPELELVVEAESTTEEEGKGEAEMHRLIQQYEARVAEEGELDDEELPEEVMDQVEQNHSRERQHYALFQARVASAPEQCLRYCFSEAAVPLCPSPDGVPSAADVPPCSRCGGPRVFEFQVMPQLLNYLSLDDEDSQALDWGTIAVYSCKASCPISTSAEGSAYAQEYVWVQGS